MNKDEIQLSVFINKKNDVEVYNTANDDKTFFRLSVCLMAALIDMLDKETVMELVNAGDKLNKEIQMFKEGSNNMN